MTDTNIADLNELFEDRHQLGTFVEDYLDVEKSVTFVEETDTRRLRNVTKDAVEFYEKYGPKPIRARGAISMTMVNDFCDAIRRVREKTEYAPQITIVANSRAQVGSLFAKATLNATTHNGDLGHGDWEACLSAQPEAAGQAWIDNSNSRLIFTDFANLTYAAGDAVVDTADLPAPIKNLAAKLGLDMASNIGDLLALGSGLDGKGESEESTTIDPHNGDIKKIVSRKGKPNVRVPTGFAVAWTPFMGYTKAILFRLSYVMQEGIAVFTCQPINLDQVLIDIGNDLTEDLRVTFADLPALPIFKAFV